MTYNFHIQIESTDTREEAAAKLAQTIANGLYSNFGMQFRLFTSGEQSANERYSNHCCGNCRVPVPFDPVTYDGNL